MSLAISKARFKQFLNQARGANVMEVHVNRQNKRNAVVLKYNGKAPKMKTRVTAEWTIPRGELDDAAIDAAIKEFLGMLRKHFFVKRGENLQGDTYADATQEAEAKPIINEGEEAKA